MTTPIEESRAAVSAAIVAVDRAYQIATEAGDINEVCARLSLASKSLRRAFDAPRADVLIPPEAPAAADEPEAQPFGRLLKGYKLAEAPAEATANSMPPGSKAPTFQHGRNVYGEPFDDEMRQRAQRDKISVPILRAIIAVRHYAVVGYVIEALTHPGSVITYTKRRDGKVGMMLVPADRVLQSEPFA